MSDLRTIEKETHKFESGYLTMLVGADPQVLLDRSPVFHAEKIVAPLLVSLTAFYKVKESTHAIS